MTDPLALLKKAVSVYGQAAVAREIGYSASAVNQVLKGSYGGSLDNLIQAVAECYGTGMVQCPVMGEIALRRCAEERKKPFRASNPLRARLYVACRECKRG